MPIKKDETGKRWVEMQVLVPGTPEQVWEAMATGPGYAAWFVKANIEPRVGGAFSIDFGQGAVTSGEVTAWDPPNKVAYVEREWSPGAPPVATEITITGRSGDRCVVRMVHSLFTSSDEWDDQIEGFESGWPGFFAVLHVYLGHFAGAPAASFMAVTQVSEDALSAWMRFADSLGFAGVNTGQRLTSSSGPERWSGVVERIHQDAAMRYAVLRLEAPASGVALVGSLGSAATPSTVSVNRYFYGENAESLNVEHEPRWRDWINTTFTIQSAEPAAT
jgi:uncharacterized protein YndB with AHSA1/START domain